MAYAGSFAGAAPCRAIELPSYKAAPLQALGRRCRSVSMMRTKQLHASSENCGSQTKCDEC